MIWVDPVLAGFQPGFLYGKSSNEPAPRQLVFNSSASEPTRFQPASFNRNFFIIALLHYY